MFEVYLVKFECKKNLGENNMKFLYMMFSLQGFRFGLSDQLQPRAEKLPLQWGEFEQKVNNKNTNFRSQKEL